MILYGVFAFSFLGYVATALILAHLTIICVTVYLHRCQAHRALDLHPAVAHVMRFWLWLTTGMVTREWVSVHRKHHARCEVAGDPHSPQLVGIHRVLWGGVRLYREATADKSIMEKYGHGTPDDWIDHKLYRPYSSKGYTLLLGVYLILFGLVPGFLIWLVQIAWIPFWAAGVINGVGHYWGYRNFETPDASRNIVPWGILIGGEELHNNHHTFVTSAKLSVKWWEFDVGWFYIRLLSFFRLAKVKRLAPTLCADREKLQLDAESIRAFMANYLRVMVHYRRRVLYPIFKEAKRRNALRGEEVLAYRSLFGRKGYRLLHVEESLIDDSARDVRQRLLDVAGNQLKTVYDSRVSLQAIWEKRRKNKGDLLDSLQEWCRQSEETGIDVLRQFSLYLKHLTSAKGPCEMVPQPGDLV